MFKMSCFINKYFYNFRELSFFNILHNMMQPNQIEFHHLPSEILIRIFSLLSFRQRIRLERVCRIWRQTALALAWLEVRTLKVTNRVLNPFTRPSRSLNKVSAILRRCGPYLEELHLGPGIGVQTRFGRYFQQLAVYQKLAHLRIDERMDIWHLQQITKHLAPQLISLSINMHSKNRSRKMSKKQMAFKGELAKLFANCQKLECLRINELVNLFIENEEEGQLTVLMPKSVKYLQIWQQSDFYDNNDKIKLLTLLNEELFPNIQFFLCNSYYFELDEMPNYERIYSLQLPLLYAQDYAFLDLPNFRQLQALHLDCYNIDYQHLIQLAKFCPKLEHLGFRLNYLHCNEFGRMRLRELEGLYAFQQLSSVSIAIQMRYSEVFNKLEFANGEKGDKVLMEILTKLDQIHPLRSLDFKIIDPFKPPIFHEEFILELLKNLRQLETFSCAIQTHRKEEETDLPDFTNQQYSSNHNEQVYIEINFDEFFSKLKMILDEQMEMGIKRSKIFKFTLLENLMYYLEVRHKIVAKWNPNDEKIKWRKISFIPNFEYHMFSAYSIVLDELIDKVLGQKIRQFLFGIIE